MPTTTEPEVLDLFSQLHLDISERLADLSEFGGPKSIDVVREDKGDVLTELEARLNKIGLAITVRTPRIAPDPDASDDAVRATVVIVATEDVMQNRSSTGTHLPALALASMIFTALRNWEPPNGGWTGFEFKGLELAEAPGEQEYEVTFETSTVAVEEDD
jgi:hypothetical protein